MTTRLHRSRPGRGLLLWFLLLGGAGHVNLTTLTVQAAVPGTVVACGEATPKVKRPVPAGLSGVTAIAAGGEHTVALKGAGPSIATIAGEPDGGVVTGENFVTGPGSAGCD